MHETLRIRAFAPAGAALLAGLLAACGGAQATTRPTTDATNPSRDSRLAAAEQPPAEQHPSQGEASEPVEGPDASLAALAGGGREPSEPPTSTVQPRAAGAEDEPAAPAAGPPEWWIDEPQRREGRVLASAQSTAESLMAARREALDRAENLLRMATGRELPAFDVPHQATRRLDDGRYRVYVLVSAPAEARADATGGETP